jgi:hypothetical protein
MTEGLVRIAEYGDEFSATNAMQYLADNGIEAKMFNGGVIMYFQKFDLYVPANRADEAGAMLREFDADQARAADEQAEGEGDVE